MINRKVILVIMDGWGVSSDYFTSAINRANTPFIDYCYLNYPNSTLQASGLNVGLPDNQVGNSEVGHMNIGSGRVVYQNLLKINSSINNGEMLRNKLLNDALNYSNIYNKNIHILGLISDGGVHSHLDHLLHFLKIIYDKKIKNNVFIHGFTDGRDTDPYSSVKFIKQILDFSKHSSKIFLSSLIGRYYAMDRNNNWDRIKKSYDLLVHGKAYMSNNFINTIKDLYNKGITDEFIIPIKLTKYFNKIKNGDLVISFNFRNDRIRQLTQALTQKDFLNYDMRRLRLKYLCMTNYDKNFKNLDIIINNNDLISTLGEVLSVYNKTQLRIAETEKYPHVTFFFSGGREIPFIGETRILCPSPCVVTYDLKPDMSARNVCKKAISEINKNKFDFICLNFANPDMVGHTGNMKATIKACEVVDLCVKQVYESALRNNYIMIITSDHGNADFMINNNGSINTSHTLNPVPFFYINEHNKKMKIKNGKLADIAPTILDIMNINKPDIMTGVSLFK